MGEEDDVDRAAILRRRALFIASALASVTSVTGARVARADEPAAPAAAEPTQPGAAPGSASAAPPPDGPVRDGECSLPHVPTPEELATARALFEQGTQLYADGQYQEAADYVERAYALAPRPKAARAAAQARPAAGDPAHAHRIVSEYLRCQGDDPALREMVETIEAEGGFVEVHVAGHADGAVVSIDDREVGRVEAAQGVFVASGRHVVVARGAGGPVLQRSIEVVAGQRVDLVMELALPAPCLSPLPCLEPWPPPGRDRPALDVVPAVGLQVAPRQGLVGASARVPLAARLGEESAFDAVIDPGGAFLGGEHTLAGLDTTLLLRGWATPKLWIAAGGTIGFLLPTDQAVAEAAGFGGPVLDGGLAIGPARLGLRVPVWITGANGAPYLVDVAPLLYVGLSMADLLEGADEPMMATKLPGDDVSLR